MLFHETLTYMLVLKSNFVINIKDITFKSKLKILRLNWWNILVVGSIDQQT